MTRTDYEYDDQGRLKAVTLPEIDDPDNPGGRVRPRYEYDYDAFGNQILIRDPMDDKFGTGPFDKETDFVYDHLGRQTSRTLPDELVERMHYDDTPLADILVADLPSSVGLGQLEYSVDFELRVTVYRYDNTPEGGGRLVGKYFYDALADYTGDTGVLDAWVEASVYGYDALGRQKTVEQDFDPLSTGDEQTTTNTYDAQGQLTQIDSPQGSINYLYDELGRMQLMWSGATAVTLAYYSYDVLGRLETVNLSERNDVSIVPEVTHYRYDKNGNLDQVENPGGLIADYDYDALNRLKLLQHFVDAGNDNTYDSGVDTLLAEYIYTPRADGKRESETETVAGTTFDWVYDELGRLTEERYDGPGTADDFTAQYFFDLASNRLGKEVDTDGDAVPDETTSYDYDANDRLNWEQFDGSATLTTTFYQYDGTTQTQKTVYQGILTEDPGGTFESQTINTYNVRGRLETVAIDSDGVGGVDQTYTYEYNDAGIRVSQTVDDGTTVEKTVYHVDPNNHTGYAQVLEEGVDANDDGKLDPGEIETTYTLGHDVIAQQSPTAANGDTLYFLYDGHGSTRALIDGQLALVQKYLYDAYGNMLPGAGLTTDPASALTSLLYSGEKTDLTGQQYLRARYYNPSTGRFNRLDPFAGNTRDPLSLHKYLYTHGDPVMGIDPSGLLLASTLLTTTGMSFSLGASILLTLSVARTFNQFQPSTHERLATQLGTEVLTYSDLERRQLDEPGQYFVHGGVTSIWAGAAGIRITQRSFDLSGNDFGDGFYTYRANIPGIEASSRLARSRSSLPIGGKPFLLIVKVDNETWDRFTKFDYGPKHNPIAAWHVDVNAFRNRERNGFLGADVVLGPTARNASGTWIVDQNLPIQYKFETIVGLEPVGILPIFPNRPGPQLAGL